MALETGTTTVGLIFKDGVVLAADKRASMGHYIASKDVIKIAKIDDHIGVTIAGSVGDAQALIRFLKNQARDYKYDHGRPIPVKSLVTLLSNILFYYRYYSPFLIQMIVGGVDKKPRLYNVDMLGGVTEEKFTATGSGTTLAISVLENEYKPNLSLKEAVKIAEKAVLTAMKRDSGSGEGVTIAAITKKGFKWVKGGPEEEE
ncbi:MAG: archaeal proteasome endopeptidase complex subunit beta [Candidatus Micrarchaeota archaeon]|nr:archaeal proteasome endopeptidase complex subunit beta [Candidatus Micrarchaeota archaeon]